MSSSTSLEEKFEQPFVPNEVGQSHKVDFDLPPIFYIYNEEENEEEKKACCEENLEEIVVKVDGGEMFLLRKVSYTFYNEEDEQPRDVHVCPLIIQKMKEQGHILFPLFPPIFIPLTSTPFVPTPDLECSDPMPTPTKKLSPRNENPNPPITPPHQKSQMFPKVGLREMDVMIKPSLFEGLILFQPNKF